MGSSRASGVALLVLASCRHGAPSTLVTRKTIGDTTFVSSPAPGIDAPTHLVETRRVDGNQLDLGRVDAGAFGPAGTIWLYDAKGKGGEIIRILDSLGQPRATAGRSGAGPGEFHGPIRLFQLADGSMLVKEMFTVRALRFAGGGESLATIDLPPVVASGWVVTPDTVGGWYIAASFESQTAARIGRYGWLHFDQNGAVIDTAWPPREFFEEPSPDGIAPGRIRTVGRDGSVLTTIPGPSRLTRFAADGRVQAMEWRIDPPRYGDDERRDMQAVEDKLNDLLHQPRTSLPDRKAPVSRILADRTGLIWAQLTTTADRIPDAELPKDNNGTPPIRWHDRGRWAALDRDGILRFIVDLPKGATLLDRAGHQLLGIVTEADGTQSVVVWRVVSGKSSP